MTRGLAAVAACILVVLTNIAFVPPASAQGNCEPITFPEGKDTVVPSDLAPECFRRCLTLAEILYVGRDGRILSWR